MNKSIRFQKFNSLNFFIPPIIATILFLVFESLLHLPSVISRMPPPSPALSFAFPEIGLKFKRYFQQEHVNCMFFGSSMVDAGLDPQILSSILNKQAERNIKCMNFGLSGSMVETSGKVAQTLTGWQDTKLVIIGVSPIEFNERSERIREISALPVFNQEDNPTMEGWLFNNFRAPWFYYGLLNRKDKDFLESEKAYDAEIDPYGLRISTQVDTDGQIDEFMLHDFYLNPVDMNALKEVIATSQARKIEIIVVEMPVKPSYFPKLIEGGSSMYEQRFIQPIQLLFHQSGMELIRTQPEIERIVGSTDWVNINHLNYSGAQKLTTFLAEQIIDQGLVK
jgi:hypothetical protein